jgi:hypothetical protein
MKKILIALSALGLVTAGLAFMILFEGKFINFETWWDKQTRNSDGIPFSPYNKYIKSSSLLHFKEANSVKFIDRHLFWKGSGAIAKPELTKDNRLVKLVMTYGGYGYSKQVKAIITGSGGQNFELGPVITKNGEIKSVGIIKTSLWNSTPLAYHGEDSFPFSGTMVTKFKTGQIIEEIKYLSGKKHGTQNRFNDKGIGVYSKEYVHGKKHGTHIFWFEQPIDPDNYQSPEGKQYSSLWMEINEKAKQKYKGDVGTPDFNEWVVSKYRLKGGDFTVRLLEHWHYNQKHGLFEGFDKFGNKTFKDEFKYGLRTKHRTFDKTK